MFSHLKTVLVGTALLVSLHNLAAVAHTAPAPTPAARVSPERLITARVGIVAGASLRSIAIGY